MADYLTQEIPAFLLELAALAGVAALPSFRRALVVENKATVGFDPVTIADRAVESVLREAISKRYPKHGIVGEEFGTTVGSTALQWVIDPIDGTRAFMTGIPTWGTLIALCEDLRPCYGVMSQPYVGELFIGGEGESWHVRGTHQRRIEAAHTHKLDHATLFATTPEMFTEKTEVDAFTRLSRRVKMTRFGADCYAYSLLAAGFIDLVVEAGLGFYDIAALVPIIESAGGVVTDWQGNPIRSGGQVIAAANAELHRQALDQLSAGGASSVN